MQMLRRVLSRPLTKHLTSFHKKSLYLPNIQNIQKKNQFYFASSAELSTAPENPSNNDLFIKVENLDTMNIINSEKQDKIRNVAIIAHVDHGKTTLVDSLLSSAGLNLNHERSMDKMDLEQEKGITIMSKCTSITYKDYKINIVDTPGHQDFGGEVERIMKMVDGVILCICATEGPMSQTKFVLQKALRAKLNPIVIINKVDRPSARIADVEDEVLELFCDINDELIEYPTLYASGRDGWSVEKVEDIKKEGKNINSVLDAIVKHVPAPQCSGEGDFQMLVSQTESNQYFGKMMIGKINQGSVNIYDKLNAIDLEGQLVEQVKVSKITKRYGMKSLELQRAVAGDIVSLAGFNQATVTNTINCLGKNTVIESIPIDPPIIAISMTVNNSPLAGKEGTKLNKQAMKNRLIQEVENDVALTIKGLDDKKDSSEFVIQGRGDLHLGILFEKMRREGFEMQVTPPLVIYKKDKKTGKKTEPIERVIVEAEAEYSSSIIEKMNNRLGIYQNCEEISEGVQRLEFDCPTRGLIGFRQDILNDTKGTAQIKTHFLEYQEYKGIAKKNSKGAIVATSDGTATAYGIKNMEKFGLSFIEPGNKVYAGMVVGEHFKEGDFEVNPAKAKELNNIRTVLKDEKTVLTPPRVFSIEAAVSYIRDDEMVEVTPKSVRIRKAELDAGLRRVKVRDDKNRKINKSSKK